MCPFSILIYFDLFKGKFDINYGVMQRLSVVVIYFNLRG